MSKRRKREMDAERRRRLKREAREEHEGKALFRRGVTVVVLLSLLVLAIYWGANNAPPYDRTQCFSGTDAVTPKTRFALFIQIGERKQLATEFIRIPTNFGMGVYGCAWPFHVHERPGDRSFWYTAIESHPPQNGFSYNMADFFDTWGGWLFSTNSSLPNRPVYFASDGVSSYRTQNFEMLIHQGPVIDPVNNTYTFTTRVYSYGTYVPRTGDYIEMIVHEPYQDTGYAYA